MQSEPYKSQHCHDHFRSHPHSQDREAKDETFIATTEIGVINALLQATARAIHYPPEHMSKSVVVGQPQNLTQIERRINEASQDRDPRMYVIRRRGQDGGDRVIMASGKKDDGLILGELWINHKYIGRMDLTDGGRWIISNKSAFHWANRILFDDNGEDIRQWFEQSEVEYMECDPSDNP